MLSRLSWVCSVVLVVAGGCAPARVPILPPIDSGAMDASSIESGVADGGQCARQQDCDDGIACTEETCVFGGVCERTTNDALCPMGQRCFAGRGCASGNSCTRNEDCDDRVACTRDVCGVGGVCQNVRDDSRCINGERCSLTLGCVVPGRCGVAADCDDGLFCNGTERCTSGMCASGTAPNCADMDMCTGDVCNETLRACEHVMLNPCGATVMPGGYTLAPVAEYMGCRYGTLGPVSSVSLAVSGSTVTVTGFPVALTGPSENGSFSAEGTWNNGGCAWGLRLQGVFTTPTQFRGSWGVSFSGLCTDATSGCVGRGAALTGTRQ
ncbi:MAG: hypothetical protein Q8Q09_09790 [Deltaproteobacteria bacterium]|nr:hypothetical protein [Deltaproteobacteria bacterium]